MTPEEFQNHLLEQNIHQKLNNSPQYAARKLTQLLLEDHPLTIERTEVAYTLCEGDAIGAMMFGPQKVCLYLLRRDLDFCLMDYREIVSTQIKTTFWSRHRYLEVILSDGRTLQIPSLHMQGTIEPVQYELNRRVMGAKAFRKVPAFA